MIISFTIQILLVEISNTIFPIASFAMLLLYMTSHQIWCRNFGRSKDPVLYLMASCLSVVDIPIGTGTAWSNTDGDRNIPQWAGLSVEAALIAVSISVVAVRLGTYSV
jgi:hypothetical protein